MIDIQGNSEIQTHDKLVQSARKTNPKKFIGSGAKIEKRKIQNAAGIDKLTGTYAKDMLKDVLLGQVAAAIRSSKPISVGFLDLDKFKDVNDTYGHTVGDAVLQEFGRYLSQTKRQSDYVGREGGEEFMVILPDTTEEGACLSLERVREGLPTALSTALSQRGINIDRQITASIGVAEYCSDNPFASAEEAMMNLKNVSDNRMYLAKENGRNMVVGSKQENILPPRVSK